MPASKKKQFKIDNYEQGLLIAAITRSLSSGHDFSPDEVDKLKELKQRLQDLQA